MTFRPQNLELQNSAFLQVLFSIQTSSCMRVCLYPWVRRVWFTSTGFEPFHHQGLNAQWKLEESSHLLSIGRSHTQKQTDTRTQNIKNVQWEDRLCEKSVTFYYALIQFNNSAQFVQQQAWTECFYSIVMALKLNISMPVLLGWTTQSDQWKREGGGHVLGH